MRWLVALLATFILSGCASTRGSFSEPLYDRSAHAIKADGYRVTRLYIPPEFNLVEHLKLDVRTAFIFSDKETRLLELAYFNEPVPTESTTLRAQGFTLGQIKSGTVYHVFDRGLYVDLAARPDTIPEESADCAVAVLVYLVNEDNHSGMMAAYIKGQECSAMSDFGNYQKSQLRAEALRILGVI